MSKPFKVVFRPVGRGPEGLDVESFAEASDWCRIRIRALDLGSSGFKGCEIYSTTTKTQVAYVAYNGRVFSGQSKDWKPGVEPIYEPGA